MSCQQAEALQAVEQPLDGLMTGQEPPPRLSGVWQQSHLLQEFRIAGQ